MNFPNAGRSDAQKTGGTRSVASEHLTRSRRSVTLPTQFATCARPFFACAVLTAILSIITASARAATLTTWQGDRAVTLANFVPDKHLVLKDGAFVEVPLADVVQLQFTATPAPITVGSGAAIWLDGGSRFSVTDVSSDENHLKFDSPFAGTGKVELDRVRAVTFQKSATEAAFSTEFASYLKKAPRTDLLILASGAQTMSLEGVFIKLDAQNVTFKWKDAEQTVARDRVHALILAPVRRFTDDRSKFVAAHGADGSILEGLLPSLAPDRAVLDVPGIGRVSLEVANLHSIDFVSGRAVAVSSLEPAQIKETPFFDHVFHFRRDKSVGGLQLSIGGIKFPHGLGVHSRCALTYNLGKQFRRLTGAIGIDDEVGKLGDVVFRVVADGREIFNSGNVKGGQPPRRISLDVTGVQTLLLEVDFGADMDVGDHADWANLRLIK